MTLFFIFVNNIVLIRYNEIEIQLIITIKSMSKESTIKTIYQCYLNYFGSFEILNNFIRNTSKSRIKQNIRPFEQFLGLPLEAAPYLQNR